MIARISELSDCWMGKHSVSAIHWSGPTYLLNFDV